MSFTLEKDFFPKTTQTVTPKRIVRHQKQADFIKLLFQGHISFSEAAIQIGISRRQAYRWFANWKQDEGLEIDREWWQLYQTLVKKNPEKALECLTRLKYRMIPQQIEKKVEVTETKINVTDIREYSLAVQAAVDYVLPKPAPTKDPAKPVDSENPPANTEASDVPAAAA